MSSEKETMAGRTKRTAIANTKALPSDLKKHGHGSNIFAPFRIVGMVTDGVPHSLFYLGGVPYVATGLQYSFQILDVRRTRRVWGVVINDLPYLGGNSQCRIREP